MWYDHYFNHQGSYTRMERDIVAYYGSDVRYLGGYGIVLDYVEAKLEVL